MKMKKKNENDFAARKWWEARLLKTVKIQSGPAKFAGQDRRPSQLVKADVRCPGKQVISDESLSTGSGVGRLCSSKGGSMYSQALLTFPEVER